MHCYRVRMSADSDWTQLPAWLPGQQADALFESLVEGIPWTRHRLHIFGREVDAPRLSCWIGDPDASYRYSGTRFAPQPWPDALLPVREAVSAEAGGRPG